MKTVLNQGAGNSNNSRGYSNEKAPQVAANRSSLGNPQMSKTQTFKSTKINTTGFGPGGGGGGGSLNINNTASALALMLAAGG